jgi:hypothetical protein
VGHNGRLGERGEALAILRGSVSLVAAFDFGNALIRSSAEGSLPLASFASRLRGSGVEIVRAGRQIR